LLSLTLGFFVYKMGMSAFDPQALAIPLVILSASLLLSGIILAAISAWFGARKYLRMKIDQLY
jgi:ABC-type antimicrobial peptide transport system permease subunit